MPKPDPSLPTVTHMEADVLYGIGHGDYRRPVWSRMLTSALVTSHQMGGVVSSLVRKGLVTCQVEARDSLVDLTPTGVQVLAGIS